MRIKAIVAAIDALSLFSLSLTLFSLSFSLHPGGLNPTGGALIANTAGIYAN